jgi:hypothetical protein
MFMKRTYHEVTWLPGKEIQYLAFFVFYTAILSLIYAIICPPFQGHKYALPYPFFNILQVRFSFRLWTVT